MAKPTMQTAENGASKQHRDARRPPECSDEMLQLAADVQMNIENHDRTVPGTDDEKFTDDVFASSVVIGRRHGACCDCVVAYKGTDTRWQWVLNRKLSTFPAFFSSAQETNGQGPGKVHFGFLAFWLSTHSRVLEACRAAARDAAAAGGEQRRRRPRVLVTGMSLGAGAAAAGLLYLAREVPEVEFTAVFFGLPRAGDRRYVRQMEAQENITGVYRVMYENDLVAHYPIPLRFGGYRQPEGAWLHLRADAARSRWRVHRWAWLLGAKAVGVLAVNKLTCGAAFSSPWMDHDMENTYHKGVMEYVQRRSGE